MGSIPTASFACFVLSGGCVFAAVLCSFRVLGEYLSGQQGQTVNLVAYAFTGSNPVSPMRWVTGRDLF